MSMQLNKTYNFQTKIPSILGNEYRIMKVTGMVDAAMASKYTDVYTRHQSVLAAIDGGIPEDINELSFIIFKNPDGEEVILADEYIDHNTIELVESVNFDIKILDTDTGMKPFIKDALEELGLKVEIKQYS